MTGDQNSRLEARNNQLDVIENQIGLSYVDKEMPPASVSEIQKYLDMTRNQLEAMSVEDCEHAAYIITSYSLWLQRYINRIKSIKYWASNELKKIVAKEFDNYSGPWDLRETKISNENEAAARLKEIEIYSEQQSLRLEYLPRSLDNLSKRIDSIKFSKMRHANGD